MFEDRSSSRFGKAHNPQAASLHEIYIFATSSTITLWVRQLSYPVNKLGIPGVALPLISAFGKSGIAGLLEEISPVVSSYS